MPTLTVHLRSPRRSSSPTSRSAHGLFAHGTRPLLRRARQDGDELFSTKPCSDVVRAQAPRHDRSKATQRLVTHRMSVAVVDVLELVEVKHEHSRKPADPSGSNCSNTARRLSSPVRASVIASRRWLRASRDSLSAREARQCGGRRRSSRPCPCLASTSSCPGLLLVAAQQLRIAHIVEDLRLAAGQLHAAGRRRGRRSRSGRAGRRRRQGPSRPRHCRRASSTALRKCFSASP